MLRDLLKGQLYDKVTVDIFQGFVLFVRPEELTEFQAYDIVLANNPITGYHDNLLLIDNFISEGDWVRLNKRIIQLQRKKSREYLRKLDQGILRSGKGVYPQQARKISNFIFEEEADSFFEL